MGKKYIAAAKGSTNDMLNAMKAKLADLEGEDIESATTIEASTQAKRFRNYEQFVDRSYPEFGIDEEDMDEEILAVEAEIRKWGEDPNQCPTFWRDDYDEPIVELDGSYYFVAVRTVGRGMEARLTPLDSPVFGEPSEYGLPVEACDNVFSGQETCNCDDELIDAKYEIQDTYGAPQAGVDRKQFEEWYEVEEYLESHPEVQDRIDEGYATIVEF